ncbi:hypothetical protein E6A55_10120 [Cupriavidus necator H16]|uniref:Uncharacterized protein n=1 Tax=Cupriavidus necator (strain ATCC 17699 / DSM 428 / KCTC 22496 / NCIMB 10442 / H16 / Stanier 337) TaxID=381666 RepID=A0AAE6DG62_CUPNH|nr:hypothetical protein E6A55_10120 [Cupriavidus necator H16]
MNAKTKVEERVYELVITESHLAPAWRNGEQFFSKTKRDTYTYVIGTMAAARRYGVRFIGGKHEPRPQRS